MFPRPLMSLTRLCKLELLEVTAPGQSSPSLTLRNKVSARGLRTKSLSVRLARHGHHTCGCFVSAAPCHNRPSDVDCVQVSKEVFLESVRTARRQDLDIWPVALHGQHRHQLTVLLVM